MFDQLQSGVAGLRAAVEQADASLVTGEQAATAVALFAEAERLACAGRTLFAKRVDETGAWARSGHPSAATWMADQAGTTVGAAIGMLQTSWNLDEQPALADALRGGELSATMANEISDAAKANPDAEADLVRASKNTTLKALKQRCARAKAAAPSGEDRQARLRARRSFRSWTERDGMIGFAGRLTPLDGAKFLAALDAETERIFCQHRRRGDHEPRERYAADALIRLVVGTAGDAAAPADPTVADAATADAATEPPPATRAPAPTKRTTTKRRTRANVRIRVDLSALRRGYVVDGETCEADGVGPISVAEARATIDEHDTLVEAILANGADIVAISRLDRYISPALRAALEERDPTCVVPGCDQTDHLEIDHVILFTHGGPTALDNLGRLCRHHHALKTRKRWRLARAPDGTWTFEPPDADIRAGSP